MNAPASQASLDLMKSIIGRVATGPELSKSITREEAAGGMGAVLRGEIDPVQVAVFLIGLRMKRETDDEYLGLLDALAAATTTATAATDDVAILADPFDGYNRCLPAAPFLPAVLAACGLPTVSTGVDSLGPKYGVTHRQVLAAAGKKVDATPADAAAALAGAGWAYCDQASYAPTLHDLIPLRRLIIKRQALTTVETLARPVAGKLRTHYLSGFVHAPYPRIYAMLARAAGFNTATIARGVEGGLIPSLRQAGRVVYYRDFGEEVSADFDPAELGIRQEVRAPTLPGSGETAEAEVEKSHFDAKQIAALAVEAGLAALKGAASPTADALVLGAAVSLWGSGMAGSMTEGAERARKALANGEALRRFTA